MARTFKPVVIETKEQLLRALKSGKIKSSKYNLLNDEEKLFVEMLVFGEYTAEQAMRSIKPTLRDSRAAANRLLANKDVADAIEELSTQKDKSFMAELSTARAMALNKLKYIMATTTDEAVAAACAKTILDKAERVMLETAKSKVDDAVSGVTFSIQVDNVTVNPREEAKEKPKKIIEVDVDVSDPEQDPSLEKEIATVGDNGTAFTLTYEGMDNYHEKE
jgi:hypothetical protein